MTSDPFIGLALIMVGGLAAASFYTPFKRVRGWSWETYWIAFGCISWVIGPWIAAFITVPQLREVLTDSPPSALLLCFIFGVLWGIGSLTNGLAIRYMGLSLGWAVPLGICSLLGTLMPPVMAGEFGDLIHKTSGFITLCSVLVGLFGIGICTIAGIAKDRELSTAEKQETVSEFNLTRGLWFAVLGGVMSACMAFAIVLGKPIAESALRHSTPQLWQNTPLFAVALLGGFTTNFVWCVFLSIRGRTTHEFIASSDKPLLQNYSLCLLAGILWYLQFLFYGMGETKMGQYRFASWSVLMVCVIIFSNLWGLIFHEWRGTSRATKTWIVAGLVVLGVSAMMTGFGSYLATFESPGS
jgi:L-rhamnose-H+ transport protein